MRHIKLLITKVLLITPFLLNGQQVEIEVQVIQSFSPQAKLYLYNGSDIELVDSSNQVSPGTYKFQLNEGYKQGMYRLDVGRNLKIDFVVNNEPDIDITTTVYAPEDSLKTSKSLENRVYWEFQKKKRQHKQHSWFIESLMDYYSDSVLFYHLLEKELENQNRLHAKYANHLISSYPDLLSSKYIALEINPIAPSSFEGEDKRLFLTQVWWDNVDLQDLRIINSPAFQSRLWSYVEQFFSDNLDKEQQDEAFIEGISKLMEKEMNQDVRISIRNALIFGFKDTDYSPVLEYLETSSFGNLKPLKAKASVRFSMKFPKVNVGDKAYDFVVNQPDGKKIKLSKIKAKYKLVIFWSTWCPHCIETLPRISEIYNEYKDIGFEVIAVSIDDEENLWNHYIKDMNLKWINVREPLSSENEIFLMYDVKETPKMFLLSEDLKIISRPSTRRQLENRLKRLSQ